MYHIKKTHTITLRKQNNITTNSPAKEGQKMNTASAVVKALYNNVYHCGYIQRHAVIFGRVFGGVVVI